MKKIFLSILILTIIPITYAQKKAQAVLVNGLEVKAQNKSQVAIVDGIEVYILSEPIREYEFANKIGNGIKMGSLITRGVLNESIETRVKKYIKRLKKDYEKGGLVFDAVIYTIGKQMDAIKFTELKTPDNDRIAIVNTIDGIPFFVMSKPIDNYEFVKTIGGGIKWKSKFTDGIANNSILEDLMKFTNKAKNKAKNNTFNAIIYTDRKTADLIIIK